MKQASNAKISIPQHLRQTNPTSNNESNVGLELSPFFIFCVLIVYCALPFFKLVFPYPYRIDIILISNKIPLTGGPLLYSRSKFLNDTCITGTSYEPNFTFVLIGCILTSSFVSRRAIGLSLSSLVWGRLLNP